MAQAATHEVIVVGGGPAALGAAVYAGRAELKTVVLERRALGGQAAETDAIENYPGFPEGVSGPKLTELMASQARRFGAEIRMEEVLKVELDGDMKIVTTGEGAYRAPAVILATGADPVKLNVPGEAELRGRGVSYCATCDAPFFRNKKVVVVGGGDSALKEGLFIAKFAREMVLVHRRQEFRAEKIYQSAVRSNRKFSFRLDCVLERINGRERVESVSVRNLKSGQNDTVPCDGVFIFVGTAPNTQFLRNLFPLDGAGHLPTGSDMMTAVPGIFAIGDVRKGSYRQIATAVGEAATAAMAAEHWLAERKTRAG
jgi:thioredoxin reductase (NADPH)